MWCTWDFIEHIDLIYEYFIQKNVPSENIIKYFMLTYHEDVYIALFESKISRL